MSLKNESKNPNFVSLIILLLGIGLGIWGLIKEECIGPDCWVGSGFLKWAGGILCIVGLAGWAVFGSSKREQ